MIGSILKTIALSVVSFGAFGLPANNTGTSDWSNPISNTNIINDFNFYRTTCYSPFNVGFNLQGKSSTAQHSYKGYCFYYDSTNLDGDFYGESLSYSGSLTVLNSAYNTAINYCFGNLGEELQDGNYYDSMMGYVFSSNISDSTTHLWVRFFGYCALVNNVDLSINNLSPNHFGLVVTNTGSFHLDILSHGVLLSSTDYSSGGYHFPYVTNTDYGAFISSLDYHFTFNYNLSTQGGNPTAIFGSFFYFDEDNDNYQSGFETGYDAGNSDGYTNGYNQGHAEGYQEGYDVGYDAGYSGALVINQNASFLNLFGLIADTPIMMLKSLFGWELFGINLFTALMSLVTGLLVVYLIKKVIH